MLKDGIINVLNRDQNKMALALRDFTPSVARGDGNDHIVIKMMIDGDWFNDWWRRDSLSDALRFLKHIELSARKTKRDIKTCYE